MKRTLLIICTLLCANVLFAQEQLAALKHNDSISVYYGANAFVQAYTAATHGDIITLSDGIFYAPQYVKKGITVRGNGAYADTTRHSTGTYFTQGFDLFDLGDSLQFSAEGIYFNEFDGGGSCNIKLNKCYVGGIRRAYGLQATNCIITIQDYVSSYSHSNIYINCILKSYNSFLPHSYSTCYNCIMIGKENHSAPSNPSYDPYQYNNCIIIKDSTSTDVILDYPVNNSVLIGFTGTSSLASSGNVVMSLSDVFENWDGESLSTDLETYVLKSSVSNSILGLDGSEVGIFGGVIPFDWTPTYSVIKRLDVPNTPDENGMLNIDVEFLTE
jgi:hypothetical protein